VGLGEPLTATPAILIFTILNEEPILLDNGQLHFNKLFANNIPLYRWDITKRKAITVTGRAGLYGYEMLRIPHSLTDGG
jgi:hypothetical protein